MPTEAITAHKIVTLNFTLKDEDGELLDSTQGEEPLLYLHGANNLVPGLEAQLEGKKVGDTLSAVVPPEEGYGLPQGPGPQAVPLDSFPEDVDVEPGMPFIADDEEGNEIEMWVVDVDEDQIIVDSDHPLAGVTLHFDIEVLGIRNATEVELQHGHPHGEDGSGGHH